MSLGVVEPRVFATGVAVNLLGKEVAIVVEMAG